MTTHRPIRRAALGVALVLLVVAAGGCVPTPLGRASSGPTAQASASAVGASPTIAVSPTPTGPTPSPSFVRPTPTPLPTFLAYVVEAGDTLTSIAGRFGTTTSSIAFWNRELHPSLDPDSPEFEPDRIRIGWTLLLVPDVELDPEDLDPPEESTPEPSEDPGEDLGEDLGADDGA